MIFTSSKEAFREGMQVYYAADHVRAEQGGESIPLLRRPGIQWRPGIRGQLEGRPGCSYEVLVTEARRLKAFLSRLLK